MLEDHFPIKMERKYEKIFWKRITRWSPKSTSECIKSRYRCLTNENTITNTIINTDETETRERRLGGGSRAGDDIELCR